MMALTLLRSPVTVNCVTPLRIISLKFSKADEYNMIMELQDNLDTLKEKTMWNYYQENVIDPIVGLGIVNVESEEVERIVGIILTNTFETVSRGESMTMSGTIGLFLNPAMMNHCCVSNTRVVLDNNTLKVIAAVGIKKGAPIYNNYVR